MWINNLFCCQEWNDAKGLQVCQNEGRLCKLRLDVQWTELFDCFAAPVSLCGVFFGVCVCVFLFNAYGLFTVLLKRHPRELFFGAIQEMPLCVKINWVGYRKQLQHPNPACLSLIPILVHSEVVNQSTLDITSLWIGGCRCFCLLFSRHLW